MWGRGEHTTLLAWMAALPDEIKQRYPALLTFQVSMLISAGKGKEAEACIVLLERYIQDALRATNADGSNDPAALNPEQAALIGNVCALRTYIASFFGDRPALFEQAKMALQNLTRPEDAGQRCGVSLVLANAYLSEGCLEEADQTYLEAMAAGEHAQKPAMALTGAANLAVVRWFQGHLRRATEACQAGLHSIAEHNLDRSPMTVDLWLTWGAILCEQGALAEAETFLRQGLDVALEQQYIWQVAWGYQALARLRLAHGQLAEAETAAQAGVEWAAAHAVPDHFASPGVGLLASIWLREGKIAKAAAYLQERELQAQDEIRFPRASEYLALARLKGTQGDSAAADLLARLIQWAEAHQDTGTLVAALLLRARQHPSGGGLREGLADLERALAAAEPEGFSEVFVVEGEPMAELLRQAVQQGQHAEYAAKLLEAFPGLPTGAPAASRDVEEAAKPAPAPAKPAPAALAEALSKREMETLQLMAQGLSNKEIAQKLYLSLRTVKYYSTGIYNKLGVDSRMQAVIRARELGLL